MTLLKELLHESKIQTIFNNSIANNLQSIDENKSPNLQYNFFFLFFGWDSSTILLTS